MTSLKEKYSKYRYCIVQECKNTSIKTPGKLWIRVPSETHIRKTWLRLTQRDPESLSTGTQIYICEDHFDLENDMENYVRYKIMGSVKRIRMKPGCVPSRFKSQNNKEHKHSSTLVEPVDDKKKRGMEENKKLSVCPIEISTSLFHNDIKDTFGNEMEVNKQTDSQTNETVVKTNITETCNDNVRHRRVDELDKFKRRLIRAIARLLHVENKPEADIWDDLKIETGCDCKPLWSRMRALTIKKLVRLFTADDKIENITKIAQLSVTDWLLYDLVLVHEKVDVIGQELVNKKEPSFLRDLFDLVEEFNIENAAGKALAKKWFDATAKYNNTGKRQCSPMLLQKRWYQLKERSRSNFYNFWFQYRGDPRKLEKANEFKPSDLQLDIVKRYKDIVTMPFLSWEVLIKEGRVALPEDFVRFRLNRNKIAISENEPDLQLIEEQVETIDLVETNDATELMNKETGNEDGCNDLNIDIVKVESLAELDDEVSVLESVHIPFEEYESSVIDNSDGDSETTMSADENELDIMESDSEQNMPKITSVTSTAYLESAEDLKNKEPTQIIYDIDYEIKAESVESVNSTLEQIFENMVENKTNNFDDFPNNLSHIDDDGIEYMDEDCVQEFNMKPETKSEAMEATNEEEPKIDLKLLLTPVVFTKKLDDMDVFRFIDYNSVKDVRVLQNAARESKPKDRKSNIREMLQECNNSGFKNGESVSGGVLFDDDIIAIKDSTKNYMVYTKSLLKKLGTKTVPKKHMQLSWLPKPQATKIDPIDCLLAADTVERILSLCKNDYVPPNLKVLRTKRKKKTDITGKITSENPKQAVSKKIVNHEKKNNKDTQKPKKGKCRTNITVQTTNIKNVCCWARRKIENLYKLNTGKHFCLYNQCVCCCKADLEAKIRELEQERKEKELIILSDDESFTAAKKQTMSKVTIGTKTDYDKDFEDQFAANLHKFKDNLSQFLTPIISLPLGDLPQTFSNESGCQTLTPNRIENTPPYATVDDTIPEDTNTHKNKPSVPLCLGKNKILISSFKPIIAENSSQNLIKINKSRQSEQILPEGCHLVLLPNRELALSINPGVELDSNQLSKLPSVLASVQKQINIVAPEK